MSREMSQPGDFDFLFIDGTCLEKLGKHPFNIEKKLLGGGVSIFRATGGPSSLRHAGRLLNPEVRPFCRGITCPFKGLRRFH